MEQDKRVRYEIYSADKYLVIMLLQKNPEVYFEFAFNIPPPDIKVRVRTGDSILYKVYKKDWVRKDKVGPI